MITIKKLDSTTDLDAIILIMEFTETVSSTEHAEIQHNMRHGCRKIVPKGLRCRREIKAVAAKPPKKP